MTFAQVYEYDYQNDLTDEYEEVSNEEQNNSQETTEVQEETPIEKEIFNAIKNNMPKGHDRGFGNSL